jgi:hypothetical protein
LGRREQGHRPNTLPRIDWFAVLVEFRRRGITDNALSAQVNIPRTTLIGYKQGAEPKHADGERLVRLWMAETQREREELPTTRLPPWLTK